MRIREFFPVDPVEQAEGNLNETVTGLAYDSRQVGPGQVFFAVSGEKADGHDYIAEAVRRGAAAAVFSREGNWSTAPAMVRVTDVRRTMGLWAAHFYGRPSRNLRTIGVTGTNGKTTLTYLIESMLETAGLVPGVIGTINYRYPGYEAVSHHTTPESPDLQEMLARMAEAGVQSVAMEVSSHALAQQRVRGVEFDVGVFTNLSRDHLDYHRDMNEYFSAKSKLFTDYLKGSPKPRKSAVIFGEDPRGSKLMERVRGEDMDVWSYGEGQQWDIHPVRVDQDFTGLRGTIQARNRTLEFDSPLIGAANLQNILGAVGVGYALGIDGAAIARGIGKLKAVPGRLEKVPNDRGIAILVDYAHSPDALEKVLVAIRRLTQKRLIVVFGCGGDRDRGKRPLMGEIAARLSDLVVLTSDNPRTEKPSAIIDEVAIGISRAGLKRLRFAAPTTSLGQGQAQRGYWVEADRRKAIGIALDVATTGDAVLIAGKGHEDYQILGARKIQFDDREVAREALASRASA